MRDGTEYIIRKFKVSLSDRYLEENCEIFNVIYEYLEDEDEACSWYRLLVGVMARTRFNIVRFDSFIEICDKDSEFKNVLRLAMNWLAVNGYINQTLWKMHGVVWSPLLNKQHFTEDYERLCVSAPMFSDVYKYIYDFDLKYKRKV